MSSDSRVENHLADHMREAKWLDVDGLVAMDGSLQQPVMEAKPSNYRQTMSLEQKRMVSAKFRLLPEEQLVGAVELIRENMRWAGPVDDHEDIAIDVDSLMESKALWDLYDYIETAIIQVPKRDQKKRGICKPAAFPVQNSQQAQSGTATDHVSSANGTCTHDTRLSCIDNRGEVLEERSQITRRVYMCDACAAVGSRAWDPVALCWGAFHPVGEDRTTGRWVCPGIDEFERMMPVDGRVLLAVDEFERMPAHVPYPVDRPEPVEPVPSGGSRSADGSLEAAAAHYQVGPSEALAGNSSVDLSSMSSSYYGAIYENIVSNCHAAGCSEAANESTSQRVLCERDMSQDGAQLSNGMYLSSDDIGQFLATVTGPEKAISAMDEKAFSAMRDHWEEHGPPNWDQPYEPHQARPAVDEKAFSAMGVLEKTFPLHVAIHKEDICGINRALETCDRSSINVLDPQGNSPLSTLIDVFHPECELDIISLVKEMIAAGADVNARNNSGLPVLSAANIYTYKGCYEDRRYAIPPEVSILLIAADADITTSSQATGKSLLFAAVLRADASLIDCLIQRGANMNERCFDQSTPLISLMEDPLANHEGLTLIRVMQQLIDAGADVNARNAHGNTALGAAVGWHVNQCYVPVGAACFLIAYGADLYGITSSGGDTALHMAAWRGELHITECLLEYGASVNAQDLIGDTPLHRLVKGVGEHTDTSPPFRTLQARKKVAIALLEAGTDRFIHNHAGESAQDLACSPLRYLLSRWGKRKPQREKAAVEPLFCAAAVKAAAEAEIKLLAELEAEDYMAQPKAPKKRKKKNKKTRQRTQQQQRNVEADAQQQQKDVEADAQQQQQQAVKANAQQHQIDVKADAQQQQQQQDVEADAQQQQQDVKADAQQQQQDVKADAQQQQQDVKADAQQQQQDVKADAQQQQQDVKADAQQQQQDVKANAQQQQKDAKADAQQQQQQDVKADAQQQQQQDIKADAQQQQQQQQDVKADAQQQQQDVKADAQQQKNFAEYLWRDPFTSEGLNQQHSLTESLICEKHPARLARTGRLRARASSAAFRALSPSSATALDTSSATQLQILTSGLSVDGNLPIGSAQQCADHGSDHLLRLHLKAAESRFRGEASQREEAESKLEKAKMQVTFAERGIRLSEIKLQQSMLQIEAAELRMEQQIEHSRLELEASEFKMQQQMEGKSLQVHKVQLQLQQTEERLQQLQVRQECACCMDAERDTVLFPCMHVSCCSKCSAALRRCPHCQAVVTRVSQIYLP